MSRARKFIRLQFIVAFLLSIPTDAFGREILRVMAWPGYADADLVQVFEKAYNVDVEVTLINTDDEMWDRLSSEKDVKFDVFAVNAAQLQRYINHGISIPLALDHIPNTAKQLLRFRNVFAIPGLTREGRVLAIPYTYSEMGLIYNRKLFETPPKSFSLMWDRR